MSIRIKIGWALLAASLLSVSGAALAHHSFVGQFDPEKIITVKGVVSEVKWVNPHAFINMAVTNDAGETEMWSFELGSPNTLIRYGWYRDTLKTGDAITVNGYLARSGEHLVNAKTVTLPDGSLIQAASSYLQQTR